MFIQLASSRTFRPYPIHWWINARLLIIKVIFWRRAERFSVAWKAGLRLTDGQLFAIFVSFISRFCSFPIRDSKWPLHLMLDCDFDEIIRGVKKCKTNICLSILFSLVIFVRKKLLSEEIQFKTNMQTYVRTKFTFQWELCGNKHFHIKLDFAYSTYTEVFVRVNPW